MFRTGYIPPKRWWIPGLLVIALLLSTDLPTSFQKEWLVQQGFLSFEDHNYVRARDFFERALQLDSTAPDAKLGWALTIAHAGGDKQQALRTLLYLQKHHMRWIEQKKSRLRYFYLALGRAYHSLQQWDSATVYYEKALAFLDRFYYEHLRRVVHHGIRACQWARNHAHIPSSLPDFQNIYVVALSLNSRYDEYSPVPSPDERILLFTGRYPREGEVARSPSGFRDERGGFYFEDIYIRTRTAGGTWLPPSSSPLPVLSFNTSGQDATAWWTPGHSILIYRSDGLEWGDLYITFQHDTGWTPLRRLAFPINTRHMESDACYVPATRELFFTSNRPGSRGDLDIFVTQLREDGSWTPPVPVAGDVNTPGKEDGIYLPPDGSFILFSSDGFPETYGFMDMYVAFRQDSLTFGNRIHLPAPLNSPDHDVYAVLNESCTRIFFSSSRNGSRGGMDIYVAGIPSSLCRQKGRVRIITGSSTRWGHPLPVRVFILSPFTGEIMVEGTSDSSGRFSLSVPSWLDSVWVLVESPEGIRFLQPLSLPSFQASLFIRWEDIPPSRLFAGEIRVSPDRSRLHPWMEQLLHHLYQTMHRYPSLKFAVVDSPGMETIAETVIQKFPDRFFSLHPSRYVLWEGLPARFPGIKFRKGELPLPVITRTTILRHRVVRGDLNDLNE